MSSLERALWSLGVRVDLLGRSQGSSDSFGFVWVHYSEPSGRRVYSSLRVLTRAGINPQEP